MSLTRSVDLLVSKAKANPYVAEKLEEACVALCRREEKALFFNIDLFMLRTDSGHPLRLELKEPHDWEAIAIEPQHPYEGFVIAGGLCVLYEARASHLDGWLVHRGWREQVVLNYDNRLADVILRPPIEGACATCPNALVCLTKGGLT